MQLLYFEELKILRQIDFVHVLHYKIIQHRE